MSSADAKSSKLRAGATALSLFSVPLNGLILRALADGPMRLADLRREVGGPAQTTLRGNLANLVELGALAKRGREDRPTVLQNELTRLGEELVLVGKALEEWLARAPGGPITFESPAGKSAIKALVGGWISTIVRALAARPLTLTELDRLIDTFTYPALERRLGAMRMAGLIELCPNGERKKRPYTASTWLREAIGPITVAARCERRYMPDSTAPIARIDVEAAFLLATPLIRLAEGTSDAFQLTIEASGNGAVNGRASGVRLALESGRVVACVTRLEARPSNWITGPALAWLDAVIQRDAELLDFGGDQDAGRAIVYALHDALFRANAAQVVLA